VDGYFDGSEEELMQFLQRRPDAPAPVTIRVETRIDTVLL
jgi:hypothetical protein